ncbi:MAG TPA: 7-carboxy-7-deazaguanine synthase QueE [Porticoccaceae bacterium]|nr:7-carboxy-7-deazaguanine synthase QueE [Porticoccaceae bacterium]
MSTSPTSPATLRITEIFHSLQGEARTVGLPTVFVRLTGCPLRCPYCDTEYAFSGGELLELTVIKSRVDEYSCPYVTITGGEPLAQPNCIALMKLLCDEGYKLSLETSGAMLIDKVDERVSVVLDLKTPGSMETDKNLYENISYLKRGDQVKFVICDRSDYEWSKARIDQHDLSNKVEDILFSPSFDQLQPAQLAEWVLVDSLRVRVQLQLHKYIWGLEPGR